MQTRQQHQQRADLVILGGGYAAVNALEAASFHLPEGARVFVVAREAGWGGQWVEQYDFVRLHQPYRAFTAGKREWDLKKPPSYLATKPEIIRHLTNIVRACVGEKKLDLVELFEYEYGGDAEDETGVTVRASSLRPELGLPSMSIRASRFIKAIGANISVKRPLSFSTAHRIHSLTAPTVQTNEWNVKMRFGEDADKEIWVIGSGKTAMDVLCHLSRTLPGAAKRLRCVAGRGTWFFSREKLNPDFWTRNSFGTHLAIDWFVRIFEKYDGTNAREVYRELAKEGLFHSAVPDPESFVAGVSSEAEIQTVREVLHPAAAKIVKGHLVDIVDEPSGAGLLIQSVDGVSRFTRAIEPGTFVINCTDHLAELQHEPVLSDGGRVCSPQWVCGFTGPTANYVTHLFYLQRLEKMWRSIPRLSFSLEDKSAIGLELFYMVVVGTQFTTRHLTKEVRDFALPTVPGGISIPLHRLPLLMLRLREAMPPIAKKLPKIITGRYTDAAPARVGEEAEVTANASHLEAKVQEAQESHGIAARGVLGGRAGVATASPAAPAARL